MVSIRITALLMLILTADLRGVRIPESARNLLLDAKVSGNLDGYQKGVRGEADHLVYDVQKKEFLKTSRWHEYGVGYQEDLGVVPEEQPAWWLAEWPRGVRANMIVLSGVYDNQAQPQTGWKIELREGGKWREATSI